MSLPGWKAYFRIVEVKSPRDIDKWIRRTLQYYVYKQWDKSGYRKLRKLGVLEHSQISAWPLAGLSNSPALTYA
ncbi:hypothetical protein AU255_03000 [Methyloprofundus sedimenti]|uniref:Group II intron maturase-specific domain-containing protein n=1 Tax=Methyloprofundus sedimenti TaxID=1420851 RepID=A0A1V8M5Q7_9GAMM|nr:hypothetical protein AU255_03000 [Methyloprofundus sedimenti]